MNNYHPNIHHRGSLRLKGYDYSQAGLYYITNNVGTRHVVSLPDNIDIPVGPSHVMALHNHNQFSKPIPGSISVIIQQYKSSVTTVVNKNFRISDGNHDFTNILSETINRMN